MHIQNVQEVVLVGQMQNVLLIICVLETSIASCLSNDQIGSIEYIYIVIVHYSRRIIWYIHSVQPVSMKEYL